MNTLVLIIIGFPILEIIFMIKVGQLLGAINTVLLMLLTAIMGVFFARIQGLSALKSGFSNIYQNKIPIYEIISGASIALAAFLLILPGFITDTIGLLLLIPFSRKILIDFFLRKENHKNQKENTSIIDGEIVERKEKDKDEV
mgnify:CR=1 FL=1|tara:strand:+ start:34 stop:462 length:429 start_codon:yes stop_codon:yes gene_type:complete